MITSSETQTESIFSRNSYYSPLLEKPLLFTVTNETNRTSANLTIPVTSVITPAYVYLDIKAQLLSASGLLSGNIIIIMGEKNKTYGFSASDFDPVGQVTLEFRDITLQPGDEITVVTELTSISYFSREIGFSLSVQALDLYIITPPAYSPIIVPQIISSGNSKIFFDLSDKVIYFTIFIPQNQAFSINITTNELIKVKYLRIEDAQWVNTEAEYEFTSNQSLSFMSGEEDIYSNPKIASFSFETTNSDPLTINLSSQLITLESVEFLPQLSNEEKIFVYGINGLLVGVPLIKLFRDRRKKSIIQS
jgi:hypothetical protein